MKGFFVYLLCFWDFIVNRFLVFLSLCASVWAAAETATETPTQSAVDSSAVFRVDEIRYDIGDVFDDSRVHTRYDKLAYDFLNWVHIETREHTVRKLLLFNEGDYVNLDLMLESERFLRDQKFLSDANISVAGESVSLS